MALDFNGTTDRLDGSSSPISGLPATLCAWIKPGTIPQTNRAIIGCYDNDSSNAILDIRIGGSGDVGTVIYRNNANVQNAIGATTVLPTTSFTHVLGTVNIVGHCNIYTNGVNEGNDSDNISSTVDLFELSVGYRSSLATDFFDGTIAEVAIWNRVLTAPEISALAKGYSPLYFRSLLKFYRTLIRNINSPNQAPSLTATGTTVVPHPKMIYPYKRQHLVMHNPNQFVRPIMDVTTGGWVTNP